MNDSHCDGVVGASSQSSAKAIKETLLLAADTAKSTHAEKLVSIAPIQETLPLAADTAKSTHAEKSACIAPVDLPTHDANAVVQLAGTGGHPKVSASAPSTSTLQDRCVGILVGGMCGDALGAVVEGRHMSSQEITDEYGVLRDFVAGKVVPHASRHRRIKYLRINSHKKCRGTMDSIMPRTSNTLYIACKSNRVAVSTTLVLTQHLGLSHLGNAPRLGMYTGSFFFSRAPSYPFNPYTQALITYR